MPRVPRLVLVTDRHATAPRTLPDVVAAALRGIAGTGLDPGDVLVQLREKDLPGRALTELGRHLRALTAEAGVALYLNDRVDVALAVGADGVQLGAGSLPIADVARIAPDLSIAVSTHGLAEVTAAKATGVDHVRFALLGPIRDTPSKRAYGPPLGFETLAAAANLGLPLVAIGGLGPEDVPALLRAGARGVAVIRAVMAADDPAAAAGAFCKQLTV